MAVKESILIVDDDKDNCKILELIFLTKRGLLQRQH